MQQGPRSERFYSLDVVRGVAVLGIFAMNIQAFATVFEAYAAPSIQSNWDAAGQSVWALSNTWFAVKFITLFSAMFGAGIVLFVGDDRNPEREALQRRRLFWLFVIGMIHAYVIWMGDILVAYAIAAIMIAGARRWKVRNLFIVGVIMLTLGGLIFYGLSAMFTNLREFIEPEMAEDLSPFTADGVAETTALMASPLWERFVPLIPKVIEAQMGSVLFMLPRTIGVMMIGMALFKLGFLTGRWPLWGYLVAALAIAPGAYISQMGTEVVLAAPVDDAYAQFAAYFLNTNYLFLGSLFQSFGYAAVIIAIAKLPVGKMIAYPFAAAGRMAFTNYLGTSLAAAFIFYGAPGLGLIGTMTRVEMATTVLGFWAVMLVVSPIWLALFRFGPLEWLWRSLTYGRFQPLMKRAEPPASPA